MGVSLFRLCFELHLVFDLYFCLLLDGGCIVVFLLPTRLYARLAGCGGECMRGAL